MAESFRWRLSGSRDQLLDDAAQAYLRLVGGNVVQPGPGLLDEFLEAADERGGLRAEEIAEILTASELPLEYEPAAWSVGTDG